MEKCRPVAGRTGSRFGLPRLPSPMPSVGPARHANGPFSESSWKASWRIGERGPAKASRDVPRPIHCNGSGIGIAESVIWPAKREGTRVALKSPGENRMARAANPIPRWPGGLREIAISRGPIRGESVRKTAGQRAEVERRVKPQRLQNELVRKQTAARTQAGKDRVRRGTKTEPQTRTLRKTPPGSNPTTSKRPSRPQRDQQARNEHSGSSESPSSSDSCATRQLATLRSAIACASPPQCESRTVGAASETQLNPRHPKGEQEGRRTDRQAPQNRRRPPTPKERQTDKKTAPATRDAEARRRVERASGMPIVVAEPIRPSGVPTLAAGPNRFSGMLKPSPSQPGPAEC